MTQPSSKGYFLSLAMLVGGGILFFLGILIPNDVLLILSVYPLAFSILPALLQADINKMRRVWIEKDRRLEWR